MPVLGKMAASVKYKSNQPEALELTVVEGDGPTLLGRDWLHRIRLDWKQVGVVSAQDLPDSVSDSEWATPIVVIPKPDEYEEILK